MKEIFAIAFSLSKSWSYGAKKEAIDRAGSFDIFHQSAKISENELDLKVAETQLKKIQKHQAWLWIYGDPSYPKVLEKMSNPPLLIYGMGNAAIDFENAIALIGTREPTPYGKRIAIKLAKEIVAEGLVVVSGMARGIDSIGHRTALQMNQPTVAVLAHGLDKTYPPEHKKMKDEICERGAVISEFPFGITPRKEFFPQRNRIISGLCKGVLVIEAGEKSGTRLTVNHALEQSREVFAVPGPIDSELSIYTNELISQGATMVRSSQDILITYPNREKKQADVSIKALKLSQVQREILDSLFKGESRSLDQIVGDTKFDVKHVLQGLTELELHGMIQRQPDSTYIFVESHE